MKRLTPQDWICHGLAELVSHGPQALKVDRLAKALKVSRGSFYWHFKDLQTYLEAVITYWQHTMTDRVILGVEAASEGRGRLKILLETALSAPIALEAAIRDWAVEDPVAAKAVALQDQQRLAYITKLLTDEGLGHDRALGRAHIIYYSYLGYVNAKKALPQPQLEAMVEDLCRLCFEL